MGRAFNIVYAYRIVDTERVSDNRMVQTYEFRVRNHKRVAADVRLVGRLTHPGASVMEASGGYVRHDDRTLHYDFIMDPDTEKVVTYKVDYKW